MNIISTTCASCSGTLIIRLDSFPINSWTGNQKLHLKCPLCGQAAYAGYVVETYEETVAREAEENRITTRRRAKRKFWGTRGAPSPFGRFSSAVP